MSQLTTQPPKYSHLDSRLTYKHGLWLVRGEVLPPQSRPNLQTVLRLIPTEAELCTNVTSVVRAHESKMVPSMSRCAERRPQLQ
jgi:hypothetical protein